MQNDTDRQKLNEEMAKQKLDMQLDRELEATFPASDALEITLRRSHAPSKLKHRMRSGL